VRTFEHPADAVLRRFFREHPRLGRRDRGFVAETVFAVLRHSRHLELLCGRSLHRMVLAAACLHGGTAAAALAAAARPDEREWLAALPAATGGEDLPLGVRAELPDWLLERLLATRDAAEVLRLGQAMQQPAPLDLRVNTLRSDREPVIERLRAEGFECTPTPYSPLGIRVTGKPALEQHPLFLDGTLEVQDEGSQLVSLLVGARRREMVVDFCAGAGGKTLALGALMRSAGRLYAFDVAERRLARLRTRLVRSGLSNVHPELIGHESDVRVRRLAGKIDRVLVDAPCTGIGTLRRNPDLKWRQSPQTLQALAVQQASILAAAAALLKPGGRLVYATCSLLPDENEEIVAAFLGAHPAFRALDCGELLARLSIPLSTGTNLALSPHLHGTDGFFAAVLEREPAAKEAP